MTERELRKLEATIRTKMEEIKKQRVSLRDAGIGGVAAGVDVDRIERLGIALYLQRVDRLDDEALAFLKTFDGCGDDWIVEWRDGVAAALAR